MDELHTLELTEAQAQRWVIASLPKAEGCILHHGFLGGWKDGRLDVVIFSKPGGQVYGSLHFELVPQAQNRTEVRAAGDTPLALEILERMSAGVRQQAAPQPTGEAQRGPCAETQRRAEMFRAIKDKHLDWSYAQVASEATRSAHARAAPGEKPPRYTADTVRNAYRAMGWEWESKNRVR